MRSDPDMPRAVAEYQARKMAAAHHHAVDWIQYDFGDVSNVDSLAALPVEDAAARWLQARDIRWQVRRAAERERQRGCPVPSDSGSPVPAPTVEIVGAVTVDSATAYVLYTDGVFRRAQPDVDADVFDEGPRVLPLRRYRGRWVIRPRQVLSNTVVGFMLSPDCAGRRPSK